MASSAIQRQSSAVFGWSSVMRFTQPSQFKRRFCTETSQSPMRRFAEQIISGDRVSLAKGITLVESTLPTHRRQAEVLVAELLEHRKITKQNTFRIGISGPPGVGKSTLIEQFGMYLVEKQKSRVAVLAVDPSSVRSGGSILGDKTRMPDLSRHPNAYVRPSPTRGTLGGVTRSTSEAILLCEAGGYDIVLVETVGVGQSETAVEDMVDAFVLLVPPAGGDELQGIKKGIVELADLVVVTKADGDMIAEARRANSEYSSALRLLRTKHSAWRPRVVTFSSVTGKGSDVLWESLSLFRTTMQEVGEWEDKRGRQQSNWMWKMLHEELFVQFETHPRVKKLLPHMEAQVRAGSLTASTAASRLLAEFLQKSF